MHLRTHALFVCSLVLTVNGVMQAAPAATATFVKTDIATAGSWKGVYGGDGFTVIDDSAAYPAYASVTPANDYNYIWSASTSDVRALQKTTASDRIAATWFSSASFQVDLNLTDQLRIRSHCISSTGIKSNTDP